MTPSVVNHCSNNCTPASLMITHCTWRPLPDMRAGFHEIPVGGALYSDSVVLANYVVVLIGFFVWMLLIVGPEGHDNMAKT